MQRIDILRAQKEAISQRALRVPPMRSERDWADRCVPLAALGIKLPHQCRIGGEGLGSCDILHAVARATVRSAPRNVGNPLSALMPAPVSTNTRSCGDKACPCVRSAARRAFSAYLHSRFDILSGLIATRFRFRIKWTHPSARLGIYNEYILRAQAGNCRATAAAREFVILVHRTDER